MQKLESIYKPNNNDFTWFENTFLKDGWRIIQMTSINDYLVILIEKETRKEKLKKLDEISDH